MLVSLGQEPSLTFIPKILIRPFPRYSFLNDFRI